MIDMELIQLKNNIIPKMLVPLENLFDQNDVAKNTKIVPTETKVEYCNIGIEHPPNMFKLSISLTPEGICKYVDLMK